MVQLPEDFVRETRRVMGEERWKRFVEAFDEDAPTSIRLNRIKVAQEEGVSGKRVPWCEDGYYLEGRPQFTFDPLFHAGCYYVQEAASMFVGHVLRSLLPSTGSGTAKEPVAMLDMCAAPGGKSTEVRSVLPEGSTLVSNEPIATRAQILLENITKWGWPDCTVTNNYPRDFRKAKARFDVILCDVPCSGEGMFRKDPNAIGEWSLQNVEKCWRLQREIVADAWECLNPGGLLIYSTCTFNLKENEENIRWIVEEYDAEVLEVPIETSWNITGSLLEGFDAPVYRFIPGITRGEGLFVCALRKRGEWKEVRGKRNVMQQIKSLRILSDPTIPELSSPNHNPSHVAPLKIDLTYPEALRYLRGEALVLPADTPRGIVNITYKGRILGPAKNIGNRANNLYPKAWRIKTTHLPEEAPKVIGL